MKLANAFATFAFVMVGATALAQAPQGQQGPITGRMGPGGASMMQGGMMGQGGQMPMMGMGMMPMMMGGMIGQADYIEGRLAFLKAELKITDAQTRLALARNVSANAFHCGG